jgi:hypothetical protein
MQIKQYHLVNQSCFLIHVFAMIGHFLHQTLHICAILYSKMSLVTFLYFFFKDWKNLRRFAAALLCTPKIILFGLRLCSDPEPAPQ